MIDWYSILRLAPRRRLYKCVSLHFMMETITLQPELLELALVLRDIPLLPPPIEAGFPSPTLLSPQLLPENLRAR